MLLVSRCPVCAEPGPGPCVGCRAGLRPIGRVEPAPAGLDGCVAGFAYEGAGRRLVTTLKYGNHRSALPWMATVLAAVVDEAMGPAASGLVVTWVPTTRARRRDRGFDQARLLARALGRRLDRPARPLLVRSGGPTQTGRNRADRLAGPRLSPRGRVPPSVLVVDDVLTTGASMSAAAAALRDGGGASIWGGVLALTEWGAQVRPQEGRHL